MSEVGGAIRPGHLIAKKYTSVLGKILEFYWITKFVIRESVLFSFLVIPVLSPLGALGILVKNKVLEKKMNIFYGTFLVYVSVCYVYAMVYVYYFFTISVDKK